MSAGGAAPAGNGLALQAVPSPDKGRNCRAVSAALQTRCPGAEPAQAGLWCCHGRLSLRAPLTPGWESLMSVWLCPFPPVFPPHCISRRGPGESLGTELALVPAAGHRAQGLAPTFLDTPASLPLLPVTQKFPGGPGTCPVQPGHTVGFLKYVHRMPGQDLAQRARRCLALGRAPHV